MPGQPPGGGDERALLGQFRLDAGKKTSHLSKGQRTQVALITAICPEPELLVLDEPTTAMDLAAEHALIELLRHLNRDQGLTVVLVTHLLPVLMNVATRVVLLQAGSMVSGPTEEVLEEGALTALYGVSVRVTTVGGRRALVVGAPDDA
jgi:ABC-type multidrug transport system ATPase subunit